jgi:hypothetical protein
MVSNPRLSGLQRSASTDRNVRSSATGFRIGDKASVETLLCFLRLKRGLVWR